jgi:hypothetical protein
VRRRLLLAAVGTALGTALSGCTSPQSGGAGSFDGFRRAVDDAMDIQALSRERDAWVLEYHVAEGPAADARRLAPPYADHVPDLPHRELSVTALTRENSLVSDYRVPAGLARARQAGDIEATMYRDRVAERARRGRR